MTQPFEIAMQRARVLACIAFACALPACSSDGGVASCVVSALALDQTTASVVAGSEVTLTASLVQEDCGSGATIHWESSESGVAVVTGSGNSGLVRGVNPGIAMITASAGGPRGSAEATATITVNPVPVASVLVSPGNNTVQVGGTAQLSAELRDAQNNLLTGRTIIWSSSNGNVATVDANGLVHGAAVGTAQITASSEGIADDATVHVIVVPVATVTIAPLTVTLQAGETRQLSATAQDVSGNVLAGRTFEWVASSPAIATVSDDGVVTANSPGTAMVSATTEGVTGNATVNVNANADVSRFAWATVETASTTPAIARSFNGTGGAVSISRQQAGQYRVVFNLLGDPLGHRPATSETVLVSALGAALRQCGIASWLDVGGAFQVDVNCTDLAGNFQDAAFSVLVVGRGTLSGASAFVRATELTADYVPDARWSWNSADAPMRITLSGSSRFVDFGASTGAGAGFFATPLNINLPGVCAPFGFTAASTLGSLRCFGPDGVPQDRLFTMLMIQGGRASKAGARYGFAAVENPTAPQSMPASSVARSSSGGPIVVDRQAEGHWRVRFTGLAAPGGAREEVALISPVGSPYGACLVDSVASSGADLDVFVRCWSAAGAPQDHSFAVLILE